MALIEKLRSQMNCSMLKNQFLPLLALLSLCVFGFSACEDDDDTIPTTEQTIAEVVAGDPQFSILLQALQQANLDGVLGQTGPFTVFAPTNAAFTAAGIDLATISNAALSETLLYHVLGASIRSTDLAEGQTYATTAAETGPGNTQLSLLVERAGNSVTLNGDVNVTTANIITENGVIHVIDKVLTPLNVVGHAAANSNFTTLVGALGAADGGLVSVLNGTGPFTVFAPVNSAFAAIQSTVDGLSTGNLAKVLLYHVVAGANARSAGLSAGPIPTANANRPVTIGVNPVTVADVGGNVIPVVLADVQATNGVIHVIGQVLIPDNLD